MDRFGEEGCVDRVWGEVVWIAWGRGGAWIGLGKRGCPDRVGEEGVPG